MDRAGDEPGAGTAMTALPLLEITLLGGFRVAVGGVAVPERAWRQRRAAAVVKLLALAPGHYLHREQVLDTIWPELDPEPAANNLRVALHHARRQLIEAAGKGAGDFLAREGDGLRLGPPERVRVDLDQFEAAVARVWRGQDFAGAEDAVRLYAGELLPDDPYEDWAADRRTMAQTSFVTLLGRAAEWHEAAGRLEAAIAVRQRQVAADPLDERAHGTLIRMLALAAQPHQALDHYERLATLLERELGVEPSAETRQLVAAIRAGSFPAPVPTAPEPTVPTPTVPAPPALRIARPVPAPVDELVGRDQELAELRHLLRSRRLLSLTGPGGVGKTRLAIAAARSVAGEFDGGAAFVDLAPLADPGLVLPELARALGVVEAGDQPLLDTLAGALGQTRLLLVIDNVEHVLSAAPVLTELLAACPGLRVLLTSRTRPRLRGEQEYPVAPLALPDAPAPGTQQPAPPEVVERAPAIALFVRRAQLARPDFSLTAANAGALAEICRRLDGLPLAIEMAAARVRLLPPAELLRRLAEPLAVLGGGARDAPARHRTLRATIAWSYDLLTPAEQALFTDLAVFAGGATLEAVEVVAAATAGLDATTALETAAALVDHSLIQQREDALGQGRLGMLETIREFARERLDARGDANTVQARHAAYFLAFAETAAPELTGPEQAEWLDRLELEIDNLRAALRAFHQADQAALLRLVSALWRFWWVHGYLTEGRSWLERAIAMPPAGPDASYAAALDGAGVLAEAQGDLATATLRHEAALAVWQALGDPRGQLRSLLNLGLVAIERGEPGQAIRLYEEALALARATGDQAGIAACLGNLGQAAVEQGAHERAAAYYRESLHLFRALGDLRNLGAVLDNLGALAFREGDYQQAAEFQSEALTLFRDLGDRQGMAETLANYGHTAQRLGDLALAEQHFADALAHFQQLADQSGIAFVLRHQGRLAYEQGDPGRAEALLRQSLQLAWELGEKIALTEALEALAVLALDRGEATRTARLLGAAGALREAIAVPLPAVHESEHRRCLETARASLGEAAFATALDEGRAILAHESLLALTAGE
jgi:predicted ATPase/DNA-binding SARP family transcriptional activator/Tfp pilus assembly protein PilF